MSYDEAPQFSGYMGGPAGPHLVNPMLQHAGPAVQNGQLYMPSDMQQMPHWPDSEQTKNTEPAPSIFHGEALARDPWAERYGHWIVLAFSAAFSLFLVGMVLFGQVPGKSFSLKGISDIVQFIGETIGLLFCVRIALRLYKVSNQLQRQLMQNKTARLSPNELATVHNEAQAARRAFMAWTLLACGIALYASGQAIWTSYDIRMNSADVPFPGIYDIGFVASYPFFLVGTLFLTRRNKASVGRVRLLLDALAVIGTALTLSWFFLLSPLIASLSQSPSAGASVLSIYFPTGDLFLVAIGALLMFSPLANRSQQPVFMLLCMGLFFLAVTDSLLAFYNLSGGFNTGTLQDVLWPLSLSLIGLAAIEYPRSIAREQEQEEGMKSARMLSSSQFVPNRLTQISMTAQTIAPFILVLATCAVLLTNVARRGGTTLIEADIVALVLILIVIARQAMTLLENNRLTMQMRGELVISRRELQVTRREADEATRSAQDKQIMEDGISALRDVHARVARGDIIARAPTVAGPLLPIAISLNLMLDRISALSQRGAKYDQLAQECRALQEGIDRLGQGLAPWPANQPMPQGATELRSVYIGLSHIQRRQENQWRRVGSALESLNNLTRRIQEALNEIKGSHLFSKQTNASFERMVLDRVIREVDLLHEQQRNIITQLASSHQQQQSAMAQAATSNKRTSDMAHIIPPTLTPRPQSLPAPQQNVNAHQNSYNQRFYQSHHLEHMPLDE
ncbi:hypothetical protein [Dictyobacter arantiisoli]|uniref:Uncharacterized protein n=1 Tax=Dictyobacter arantiisoli TaxID=2014874 RepID=A0A5A5T6V4_9CHLR|nr:hypothetical protein [Dictyobacter arantiisoli]GCF06975.1 hypothetical protein KDI_05390 [Dictyobacter arantiisoli]